MFTYSSYQQIFPIELITLPKKEQETQFCQSTDIARDAPELPKHMSLARISLVLIFVVSATLTACSPSEQCTPEKIGQRRNANTVLVKPAAPFYKVCECNGNDCHWTTTQAAPPPPSQLFQGGFYNQEQIDEGDCLHRCREGCGSVRGCVSKCYMDRCAD